MDEKTDAQPQMGDDTADKQSQDLDKIANGDPTNEEICTGKISSKEKTDVDSPKSFENAGVHDDENNDEIDETLQTERASDESVDVEAFELTTGLLFSFIKELEEKFLPEVKKLLETLDEKEGSLEEEVESMTTEVGEQCSNIISNIEQTKEQMTEEILEDKEKRQTFIEERKKELTRVRDNSEVLLDLCKEHLMKGGKLMLDFFHEKCPTLLEMEREVRPINVESTFERGVIDVPELKKEIGKLTLHSKKIGQPRGVTLYTFPHPAVAELEAKLLSTFPTMKIVGDIQMASANEAWITDENSYCITKYNNKGEVLKQINTSVFNECFIIDKESNFLVCNYWESKIMKITPEGNVSVLIDDLPALPTGICFNLEEDIVVCMQDHPWIPIYSPDGKIKKGQMTIMDPANAVKPKHADDNLTDDACPPQKHSDRYVSPYRVVQSTFGDYYVVDAVWPFTVISLDMDGKFRWKYVVDQASNVYPYNICCTLGQDVIITDVETQKFHVINPSGHLIRLISFQELGLVDAWSMSIDEDGRLWTGQDDGKVHIIDLNLD